MSSSFPVTSRYYGLPCSTLVDESGREVVYVLRRFLPTSSQLAQVAEHRVAEDERLDHIAARQFADPELFWRLCDANDALRPGDLLREPGRVLRVTLPEGMAPPQS